MIAIVEGLNPMHFLSFVILFFCVLHSCCYLVRFEKLLMHSESPIDEVGEGDKVLGPILDGNISENDSVVEDKGKRGGVRRDKKFCLMFPKICIEMCPQICIQLFHLLT